MNNTDCPLVSIGMPLYNEARFVKDSLSSMLSQNYPKLEIIISDNASDDETLSICRQLIESRTDVSIHRFETNMGAAENFKYVLRASTGRYFMWASGHDLWDPTYISETVALLEMYPKAVIAFGSSVWIDENGCRLPRFFGYTDTRGMTVVARFFTIFWGNMHPVLGLIRRSALSKKRTVISTVGADLVLLSRLALQGDFIHAPCVKWQRREFRGEENHAEKLRRYRRADCGLTHSVIDKSFPLVRLPLEIIRNVLFSSLKTVEKIFVLIALLASLPIRYFSGKNN